MDTKKFIIIIVIILAVVIVLVKLLPKKVDNTNTNTGGGNTGGGNNGGGNGSGTDSSAGTRNYNASTWKVGDTVYASVDTQVTCDDCWTPNWLLDVLGDNYHFTAGSNMGTFVSFDGSVLKTLYDGNNYLSYISNKPYTKS